jgi:hypothetical protein
MNTYQIHVQPLERVNGIPFGSPLQAVCQQLGPPDEALENYTGEYEVLFNDSFYRFYADQLVECTFPDTYQFFVNDIQILSVFDWLSGCDDVVDRAKFRISKSHGIAYDYRMPDAGSVTVFAPGHWDALLT